MKYSIVLLIVVMAHIALKSQNLIPFEDAKTKKHGYKNEKGVVVIPAKYDFARAYFEQRAEVLMKYKWGFIDPAGKEIIPLKYESTLPFSEGLAAVKLHGRWGFVDKAGKEICPPQYSKVYGYKCGRALIRSAGKTWFINKKGEKVFKASFIDSEFSEGLVPQWISKSTRDNWGYADTTGKIVIPDKYYSATDFKLGIAIVSKNTDNTWLRLVYGAIDKTGKEVIPIIYNLDEGPIAYNSDGLAVVSYQGKYGVIDRNGKAIVNFNYSKYSITLSKGLISTTADGKAMLYDISGKEIPLPQNCSKIDGFYQTELLQVVANGKTGFIDKTGKVVVPLKYEYAFTFDENGVTQAQLNGKYGLINTKGVQVAPFKYDYMGFFNDGFAEIQLAGKYGCINRKGIEIVPPRYDESISFYDGVAKVVQNGEKGIVDKTGKLIVPCMYQDIAEFGSSSFSYTTVTLDDKVGLINKSGKIILPVKYKSVIGDFNKGLFLAEEDYEKYTLFDKTGKVIVAPGKYRDFMVFGDLIFARKAFEIYAVLTLTGLELQPPRYDDVASLGDNLVKVKLNRKYGLFDLKTAKEISSFKYDEISSMDNTVFLVKLNGKYGMVNSAGKEITEIIFEEITRMNEKLFKVRLNGKYGIVSAEGKEIMPAKITEIVSVMDDLTKDGEILVKSGSERYWIDENGNILNELD